MAEAPAPRGRSGGMQTVALRLHPGEEVKSALMAEVQAQGLDAAFVATCVGSVRRATLRMAHATAETRNEVVQLEGPFEVVSLVGTFEAGGASCHLHVSLSDATGAVVGGHLVGAMEVFTTVEVVLGVCTSLHFERHHDEATGFKELHVQ